MRDPRRLPMFFTPWAGITVSSPGPRSPSSSMGWRDGRAATSPWLDQEDVVISAVCFLLVFFSIFLKGGNSSGISGENFRFEMGKRK